MLVDATRKSFRPAAEPELLMAVISEISDEEILVLGAAYDLIPDDPSHIVPGWAESLAAKVPEALHPRLPFLVTRLEGLGLIGDSVYRGRSGEMRPNAVGIALVRYLSSRGL